MVCSLVSWRRLLGRAGDGLLRNPRACARGPRLREEAGLAYPARALRGSPASAHPRRARERWPVRHRSGACSLPAVRQLREPPPLGCPMQRSAAWRPRGRDPLGHPIKRAIQLRRENVHHGPTPLHMAISNPGGPVGTWFRVALSSPILSMVAKVYIPVLFPSPFSSASSPCGWIGSWGWRAAGWETTCATPSRSAASSGRSAVGRNLRPARQHRQGLPPLRPLAALKSW